MNTRQAWLLLPKQLRELPADLVAVLMLVIATNLSVFLPVISDSPVRVVAGLAFVLFVPGYAFIAALFPEAGDSPPSADATSGSDVDADAAGATAANGADAAELRDRGIDSIERAALSFGLSIAIVPLIGLALNFTPFGIQLVPILMTLSGFTVITVAVAAVRRWRLPESERFQVPYRDWLSTARTEAFAPESRVDAVLNVILVIAIVLAMSSVVYAVVVPPDGEQFTEFYLLTKNDDSELVAANYPETLNTNESVPLHIGIENNEYQTVEYTVIVQLQRVDSQGNQTANGSADGEANVTNRTAVDQFSTTLPHNETWLRQHNITADTSLTGEDLRLTFLLYQESPPADPTRENAYRNLHLWVDIPDDNPDQESA